jgi:hypothetical protein
MKVVLSRIHFTMKRFNHVKTGMNLNVLAYNMKWVSQLVGMENRVAIRV